MSTKPDADRQTGRTPERTPERKPPRFEASLGPVPRGQAIDLAAELDLDRLPDVDGKVRLLLTPEDAQKLLDRGIEVRLLKAVPIRPLDPKLVMGDAEHTRAAESQLAKLRRKGER